MRKKLFKKSAFYGSLLSVLIIVFSSSGLWAQDVNHFLTMLDSDKPKQRIDAAKQITRSGLTDPILFDTIQEKLLSGFTQDTMNFTHIDEMAWLCKALASSGNDDYAGTLKQVAQKTSSEKLRRHARSSLDQIPIHARRNKMLQSVVEMDSNLTPEEQKRIAMIQSQDPVLMRDAAKMTYRNPMTGEAVTNAISEVLLDNIGSKSAGNRTMTDALAWMCKALGRSGNSKYRSVLTEVIENSTSEKLKKHARKSLSML
ncbi:MAG: hypothetical protein LC660_10115 [Desulfobacteraceae bacterium]|nr:hypothetical protein [Desulfobacteraceae bacterium]